MSGPGSNPQPPPLISGIGMASTGTVGSVRPAGTPATRLDDSGVRWLSICSCGAAATSRGPARSRPPRPRAGCPARALRARVHQVQALQENAGLVVLDLAHRTGAACRRPSPAHRGPCAGRRTAVRCSANGANPMPSVCPKSRCGASFRSLAGSNRPPMPSVEFTTKRPERLCGIARAALQQLVHHGRGWRRLSKKLPTPSRTGRGTAAT